MYDSKLSSYLTVITFYTAIFCIILVFKDTFYMKRIKGYFKNFIYNYTKSKGGDSNVLLTTILEIDDCEDNRRNSSNSRIISSDNMEIKESDLLSLRYVIWILNDLMNKGIYY